MGFWKFASEFGTNHATVSLNTSCLSPDNSGFDWLAANKSCVIFCFVHISMSLVQKKKNSLYSRHKYLQENLYVPSGFENSASKSDLGTKLSTCNYHLKVQIPVGLHGLLCGRRVFSGCFWHMLYWLTSLQYAHSLAETPLSPCKLSEASMKPSCLFGEFPPIESQVSQNLYVCSRHPSFRRVH